MKSGYTGYDNVSYGISFAVNAVWLVGTMIEFLINAYDLNSLDRYCWCYAPTLKLRTTIL